MADKARVAREAAVLSALEEARREPAGETFDRLVAALKENFPRYTGVYIYLLQGDMLVLGPFRGRPTEHTHIPVGAGICGRAARVKATVTVDDVNADPEYLACSLETRSEIVVPIMRGEQVLGEIDIDSDVPSAFSPEDRAFLERVAAVVGDMDTD